MSEVNSGINYFKLSMFFLSKECIQRSLKSFVYKTLYSVCGEFLLISLKMSIIKNTYFLLVQIIQAVMERVCIIHCTYNILNRAVKGYGV